MYVQVQTPVKATRPPIVFVHGCCLSSKTWETTPDGRMGWSEYFTRKGFPTYLAEQAGRGRSGFNGSVFNDVRDGARQPGDQPRVLLGTREFAWKIFRFGPRFGEAWPDEQFPIDHVDALYKQIVPDMILTQVPSLRDELRSPVTKNPTIDNLAALAVELNGAILVGHSQSSGFPTQAVLKGKGAIKGIVQLETGCFDNLTPEQIAALSKIPILMMVGDHFGKQPQPNCIKEMRGIKAAHGDMTFIALPDLGVRGNSHMFMQDRNNLQIADLIIEWIDKHVK
jgi:pimeloyl-ACP methyl ester carboxylesterase